MWWAPGGGGADRQGSSTAATVESRKRFDDVSMTR